MKFSQMFKVVIGYLKEKYSKQVLSFSNTGEDKDIGSGEGLTWKELRERYEIPKWYVDAKFGIWTHWGAQSVPEYGGGWYARHMYQEDVGSETWGKEAYSYHVKNYGHPSEIGFKDVAKQWDTNKLDTDELLRYFTEDLGAKFFMALANHHDNFDNWDSTHHPWNSVKVGPNRDIIGEFSKSAKKLNIPFGVTIHNDRYLNWWVPAFGSDKSGALKGVPYDGHHTVEDGVGKWWEGLNPQDLYGLPPEQRTKDYILGLKRNWLKRHEDLLTKYEIDYVWFDGWKTPVGNYGKEAFRVFLNQDLQRNGKFNAVIAGKYPGEPLIIKDLEVGVFHEIIKEPWQSIDCFTGWFYKKDNEARHDANSIIQYLIDVVSKNGNMILAVEMLPDGSIVPDHKPVLDEFGAWLKLNGESIYSSKPWVIYGDNITSVEHKEKNVDITDTKTLKKAGKKKKLNVFKKTKTLISESIQLGRYQFNNRNKDSPPYTHDEVRFTTKGDDLFIFVLNPQEGPLILSSLGKNTPYNKTLIRSMELIGSEQSITFEQSETDLCIEIPRNRPNKYVPVFKVLMEK